MSDGFSVGSVEPIPPRMDAPGSLPLCTSSTKAPYTPHNSTNTHAKHTRQTHTHTKHTRPQRLAHKVYERVFALQRAGGLPPRETCDLVVVDRSLDPVRLGVLDGGFDVFLGGVEVGVGGGGLSTVAGCNCEGECFALPTPITLTLLPQQDRLLGTPHCSAAPARTPRCYPYIHCPPLMLTPHP
jgi:hypothetical protein